MTIQIIGILGAGTMGTGIAIATATAGFETLVVDRSAEAIGRAEAKFSKFLTRQVEKSRMDETEANNVKNRLRFVQDLESLVRSDLIIEAVFEDLSIKQTVLSQVEKIVGETSILATNTSALKVGEIADALARKEQFCGLHFFSPAEINPVVELVRGAFTSQDTVNSVLPVLEQCGKSVIQCKDQSGFALNRFFCPYTNEAVRCFEEGLGNKAQIDSVAQEVLGVAIGPFAVMNIVKPSINLAAVSNLGHMGGFYKPAAEFVRVGTAQQLWQIEDAPDIIDQDQKDHIADRLLGAIFYAVLDALFEEVACPEDFDMGAVRAFTFAQGPVSLMCKLGRDETLRLVSCCRGVDLDRARLVLMKLI